MDINKVYQLITQKLITWLRALIKLLPNIVLAAIVLVLGLYIAKWIRKLARQLIRDISHNETLNNLVSSIAYLIVIGITAFTVLSTLHLDKAVTSILAGAGIAGLALAFAFQDIASNFISGIFISFRRPIHVGDIVQVKDYMGKVTDINLRDTIIQTFQGQMVIIPNKDVYQNPIENFSMLGKRRLDLTIGISYGEDLEKVKEITLAAVANIEGLSPNDTTTLFYTGFGDSSINYVIRLWSNSPEQPAFLEVGSQAIMCIKKAYDAKGIVLPFPIRTLDFGIKGGIPLSDMPLKFDTGQKINS